MESNKVDSGDKIYGTYEFNALGLGEPWSISAATGSGTGDLLDEIIAKLPSDSTIKEEVEGIYSFSNIEESFLCDSGGPY